MSELIRDVIIESEAPLRASLLRALPRRVLRLAWPAVLIVISAAGWWGVWLLCCSGAAPERWSQRFVLPAAILLLVCMTVLRHEWHWQRPMRRLLAMLPQIRAGQHPIDDLATIRGGSIDRLIPMLQALLHDLREQQREMASLDHEMQQRVANRTGALERALNSLRQQATRDPLTGLYNRRLFDQMLPRLVENCQNDHADLGVLMIDIDHFKSLNDTLGHAAGDQLLRDVGQLIRSSIRAGTDAGFRIGGDEFVILMPAADSERATTMAQRLISLVDAHGKLLRTIPKPRLAVGIAMLCELAAKDANAAELLRAADRKLYQEKARRRSARV